MHTFAGLCTARRELTNHSASTKEFDSSSVSFETAIPSLKATPSFELNKQKTSRATKKRQISEEEFVCASLRVWNSKIKQPGSEETTAN